MPDMEWLIIGFALIFAFIAWAPGGVTQAGLAGAWLLGILFIVGEIVWLLGRALLY